MTDQPLKRLIEMKQINGVWYEANPTASRPPAIEPKPDAAGGPGLIDRASTLALVLTAALIWLTRKWWI